jgi:hypothetical protein
MFTTRRTYATFQDPKYKDTIEDSHDLPALSVEPYSASGATAVEKTVRVSAGVLVIIYSYSHPGQINPYYNGINYMRFRADRRVAGPFASRFSLLALPIVFL